MIDTLAASLHRPSAPQPCPYWASSLGKVRIPGLRARRTWACQITSTPQPEQAWCWARWVCTGATKGQVSLTAEWDQSKP